MNEPPHFTKSHRAERLTTQFLEFALVNFFTNPGLAFDLLGIYLPLREEANLTGWKLKISESYT